MRKVRLVSTLLTIGTFVSLGTPLLLNPDNSSPLWPICMILGLAFVIGDAVYLFLFWRCDYCHWLLPLHGFYLLEYCPYCGNPLEDDKPADKN